MNRLWVRATIGFASTLMAAATALPADGATSGGTTATFQLSGGALSITVPATANLGTAATGATAIGGPLGVVQVTDARGSTVATWTATALSGAFTAGAGQTIPAADVNYWSGVATSTTGVGVFTPGQAAAVNEVAINAAQTAFALTAGVGNNQATWNPTIDIHLPGSTTAGTYAGTITHSVS
jgi:hypothetical protein